MLTGLKNRLLQFLALYAPGAASTRVWLHRMRGVSIGRTKFTIRVQFEPVAA